MSWLYNSSLPCVTVNKATTQPFTYVKLDAPVATQPSSNHNDVAIFNPSGLFRPSLPNKVRTLSDTKIRCCHVPVWSHQSTIPKGMCCAAPRGQENKHNYAHHNSISLVYCNRPHHPPTPSPSAQHVCLSVSPPPPGSVPSLSVRSTVRRITIIRRRSFIPLDLWSLGLLALTIRPLSYRLQLGFLLRFRSWRLWRLLLLLLLSPVSCAEVAYTAHTAPVKPAD